MLNRFIGSAGIGRTGTFIALDTLLSEGRKTKEIDVYTYAKSMREDRTGMIQTYVSFKVLLSKLLNIVYYKYNQNVNEYIICL